MPYIIRDATTNNIIGHSELSSSDFVEQIDVTHPDYVAYLLVGGKAQKIKELKGKRGEVIGGCVEYTIL